MSADGVGARPADHLLVEQRGPARWLTLNRPDRRNALTVDLVHALADAVEEAVRDDTVRVVVLTGAGSAFCSGGDLPSLSAIADEGGAQAVTTVIYRGFQRLVRTLGAANVPVVAAVNGPALGAGLDLALACDLRIGSTAATYASSWIGVGLVTGMGGSHLLTRAIGSTRASEMVLLGGRVDAARALTWGIVNDTVAPEDLVPAVDEVSGRLAALSRPGLAHSKASLRRAGSAEFEHELAVLGAVQGGLLTGPEFRAATARFREKP